MSVKYADNHASDVFRFINLSTKKVMLSRDVTWLDKLHGEIFNTKDIASEYNLNEQTNRDEYIEIDIEDQKISSLESIDQTEPSKRIPKEVRNLQTSYNGAGAILQECKEIEEEMQSFSVFALASETIE